MLRIQITTILIVAAVWACVPFMVQADTDQGATTLIRARVYGDASATGQWSYGDYELKLDDDDFVVTSTFTSTGGVWTVDLEGAAGLGVLTSVIAGDGIISNNNATEPTLSVNAGDGIEISGDQVIIDYNTGEFRIASSELAIATNGIDDTHIDWGTGAGQVAPADFDGTDVTAAEFETLTDTSNADALHVHTSAGLTHTLDEVYNDGHSVTVDAGPFTATQNGGSATVHDSRNICGWFDSFDTPDDKAYNVNHVYILNADSFDYANSYFSGSYSEDNGSTINTTLELLTGGAHFGVDEAGNIYVYDAQGDTTYVKILTPANLAASWDLTLPPDNGNSGEVWTTDGNGVGTWTAKTTDTTVVRHALGFGTNTPLAGAGTVGADYVNGCQWAVVGYAGTITKIGAVAEGWVDDNNVDINVFYGAKGSESTYTIDNISAVVTVDTPGSPPSVSAGNVIYCNLVNTGGDDVITMISVTVWITE